MRVPFTALFERRAIGTPYDLWTYLGRGIESLSGQQISESTALSVAAVMTCVALRSRSLASLPCGVFERTDDRSRRPAVNHPLTRVLSQPNSWQTRSECFGMLEAHRVLRGNAYAWKNYITARSADGVEREQIAELVPLHPDRITVEQPGDLGGPLVYTLTRKNGLKVPLPQREVLHLRGLSTDGFMGRSVLQDARELIGGALATQEHSNTTWKRGGLPSVVLKHPKTLSEKAKDSLEKSWERVYGGSKDLRRVAVIEEGMDLSPLTVNLEDLQFLDTRKFSRGEIAGWFFVPPHMIGDTEKSTSWGTGIEQQQIGFLSFTLRPDLVCWEQRMNLDLIQVPAKYFVKFEIKGFMRGDSAAQSTFYDRMVRMGAYSINEVRASEDLNPIAGGDEHIVDMNRKPIGTPDPEPAPQPDPGAAA